MNLHALLHEPKSQLGYANPNGRLTLRMRTAADDVKMVNLIYGDKYSWSQRSSIKMEKRWSDGTFDYFEASVKPPHHRLAYYFEVFFKGPKPYFYTEWGASDTLNEAELDLMYFNFPYVNEADIHVIPSWVESAIFYQIFPERFANGNPENDPKEVVKWDSVPTRDNFFGGDLAGIRAHLDHLVDLGINAIYMTPVFESPSNHKYNTTDYFQIDPAFGDLQDLKQLVEACHERHIRVVLDAVFNHSGVLFKPFQDVIENGEASAYKTWFHIRSFPVSEAPLNYETFSFEAYMPKLNTGNPEVIDYLCRVGTYWIEAVGIDGWRLDVANEVDHEFWRTFKREIKKVKPEAYILGEIWHNAKPWLLGDQFDGAMNYPFTKACISFFVTEHIDQVKFRQQIDATYIRNTAEANKGMLNILDSHDTPRFLTRCREHQGKLKLAVLFQMTFVGAPSIYYGSEVGMTGGADPECRKAMVWDVNQWDKGLYHFYKEIIRLRKTRSSMRSDQITWLETKRADVLAYIKHSQGEHTLVIMNRSEKKRRITLKKRGFKNYQHLGGRGRVSQQKNGIVIELEAYGYTLLDLETTL